MGGFGKQKKAKNDLKGHFLHLTLNSFGLDVVCPPVLCMEAGALDLAQPKLDCCSRFYSIGRASVPLKHRNARRLCTSQLHRNLWRIALELEHQHLKAEKAIRTSNPTSTVIVTWFLEQCVGSPGTGPPAKIVSTFSFHTPRRQNAHWT